MDSFAKGLKVAAKLVEDRVFENVVADRYASFSEGIGADIVAGKVGFKQLEQYALDNDSIVNRSGRQELLKSILNQYILAD